MLKFGKEATLYYIGKGKSKKRRRSMSKIKEPIDLMTNFNRLPLPNVEGFYIELLQVIKTLSELFD